MKSRSNLRIKLTGDDGIDAVIEFKRPARNAELKKEALKAEGKEVEPGNVVKEVLDLIVKVEGIVDEDGRALSVEEVKNTDDEVLEAAIIFGYFKARETLLSPEFSQKKFSGIV